MIDKLIWTIVLVIASLLAAGAQGQSSSLYNEAPAPPPPMRDGGRPNRISPGIAAVSFTAVPPPEQRMFGIHDLVTIVIRESTTAENESTLDTKKDSRHNAELEAWPGIRGVEDLWNLIASEDLSANPRFAARFNRQFKGDGSFERSDTFTSRITARVIDVKPNGTLVLEARKYIQNDKEELDLVVTGTCRAEDITADNTVLSTQLYDLRLQKHHRGEVRKTAQKGILTRVLDFIIPF